MKKIFILFNFAWFFSRKIAKSKSNKNLSNIIIRIGQVAVALGIMITVISVAIGLGSKKAIKNKLADFNGHIVIKPYSTNNSYNSEPLDLNEFSFDFLDRNEGVESYQKFAQLSAVLRTEKSFEGLICKGLSSDYIPEKLEQFLVKGRLPIYKKNEYSEEVLLPKIVADRLLLDVDSSFVAYFIREEKEPIYRRFQVVGLFDTMIRDIDENFLICDLKQIQKIKNWNPSVVGGIEVYVKDIEKLDEVNESLGPKKHIGLYFETATERFRGISEWIENFDLNIIIIIVLMMVVVTINMMMVLLILIIERVTSIGVLKTLGAGNSLLRRIFINYAILIMVPGIIIGNVLAIGFLLIQKYTHFVKLDPENYFLDHMPVYLSVDYILLITFGTLIVTAIILILPSQALARISPIKAIKFN